MEQDDNNQPHIQRTHRQPRQFVYRSVEPDAAHVHPLRRSTDTPRPFQGVSGELCPRPVLLKFRVYLKLN